MGTINEIPSGSLAFFSRKTPLAAYTSFVTGCPYDLIGIIVQLPGDGAQVVTVDTYFGSGQKALSHVTLIPLSQFMEDPNVIAISIRVLKSFNTRECDHDRLSKPEWPRDERIMNVYPGGNGYRGVEKLNNAFIRGEYSLSSSSSSHHSRSGSNRRHHKKRHSEKRRSKSSKSSRRQSEQGPLSKGAKTSATTTETKVIETKEDKVEKTESSTTPTNKGCEKHKKAHCRKCNIKGPEKPKKCISISSVSSSCCSSSSCSSGSMSCSDSCTYSCFKSDIDSRREWCRALEKFRIEILKDILNKHYGFCGECDAYQILSTIHGYPIAEEYRSKNAFTSTEFVGEVLYQAGLIFDDRYAVDDVSADCNCNDEIWEAVSCKIAAGCSPVEAVVQWMSPVGPCFDEACKDALENRERDPDKLIRQSIHQAREEAYQLGLQCPGDKYKYPHTHGCGAGPVEVESVWSKSNTVLSKGAVEATTSATEQSTGPNVGSTKASKEPNVSKGRWRESGCSRSSSSSSSSSSSCERFPSQNFANVIINPFSLLHFK